MRFRLSPEAAQDVEAIWEFIASDSVTAARAFGSGFTIQIVPVLHGARDIEALLDDDGGGAGRGSDMMKPRP